MQRKVTLGGFMKWLMILCIALGLIFRPDSPSDDGVSETAELLRQTLHTAGLVFALVLTYWTLVYVVSPDHAAADADRAVALPMAYLLTVIVAAITWQSLVLTFSAGLDAYWQGWVFPISGALISFAFFKWFTRIQKSNP